MTREERELSITYLEGIKEKYIEGEGYERHPLPEYYAIEMSIKALKQESGIRNCSGCKYSKDNHNAGTEEYHLCMWENQYTPTTKNDLGVDCISREDTLRIMRVNQFIHDGEWAMKLSMNEIKDLPSVTPQEPFINKPCVSEKQCEHDKNAVIDKIRAEIEGLSRFEIRGELTPLVNVDNVLDIIGKYMAESEGEDGKID